MLGPVHIPPELQSRRPLRTSGSDQPPGSSERGGVSGTLDSPLRHSHHPDGVAFGCRTSSGLPHTRRKRPRQTAAAAWKQKGRSRRRRLLSSSLEVAFRIRLRAQKAFNYRGGSRLPALLNQNKLQTICRYKQQLYSHVSMQRTHSESDSTSSPRSSSL